MSIKNVQTIGPSGTIFRRSALEEIGGFDESFPAYEDNDLLIRLLSEFHVVYLDRTLVVRRRDREDQLTNDFEAVTQGMEFFLEKHAEALTPVTRATKLNILAEKYEQLNENQKARDTIKRIATLIEKPEISLTATETGQLQKQLALWEARHNNPTAARQRLRRAIQFNPIDKATWFYYFWLHFGTFGYNLAEEFREHVYRPIAARFGD